MLKFYLKKTTIVFAVVAFLSTTTFSQDPPLILSPVISGLTSPLQIVNAGDGTDRLFVVLQGGAILVYNSSFVKLDTFLIVTNINTGGEEGLLSLAFHPEYENAASPFFGMFFVYYTTSAGNLHIARYNVSTGNPNKADPDSKDTVLQILHPSNSNHNGGTLHFGNDGYLYLATGDGGSGGDPPNNAQNPLQLLGKMIRIDVNSSATAPFYSIPASNPYVGVTVPDTLDEIYAFGLRNPFRWSFDRATNDIWIGDVGQGIWEEIDFKASGTTAGANYGWRCYEGMDPYNTSGCGAPAIYTFPIYQYPNAIPSAVTGGVVYRGSKLSNSALAGFYLAADFYSGRIYKIRPNGSSWTIYPQAAVRTGITNFGETESGEILAVSLFGSNVSSVNVDAVLPVQLISFTANARSSGVLLNWKTVFEQNLDQFEVEYSFDGINFSDVNTTEARNEINGAEYNFDHPISLAGKIFYRLKMVDFDGAFVYSQVINVSLHPKDGNFVHPSVVSTGTMTVYINEPWQSLQVVSSNGAEILHKNLAGQTGRINIPVLSTMQGVYIVILRNDEKIISQKILITPQ